MRSARDFAKPIARAGQRRRRSAHRRRRTHRTSATDGDTNKDRYTDGHPDLDTHTLADRDVHQPCDTHTDRLSGIHRNFDQHLDSGTDRFANTHTYGNRDAAGDPRKQEKPAA